MKRLFSLALLTVFILASIGTVSAFENIFPGDAYDMLDPENTAYKPDAYILDVRTPAEWYWVGHPGKDKCDNGAFLEEPVRKVINIPWYVWEYVPQDKKYDRKIPNRFFDEEVVRQFDPGDIIIVMCRSGKRSVSASEELEEPTHPACKRLEELGYYNIYNMLGGFEGGRNKATDPANCQHRTKDEGWKNKGLPYVDNDKGIWTPQQRGRSLAE
ncbi:MAG: hypothetical protein KAU38_03880 [Desulfobacterales bacterium]|nr:hypothetical protein [Desulfobacterales bacterium]